MAGQGLFDALSGAAGHPVDRQGLNSFVANSQQINGLRSAQTEEALLNAQKAREEQDASGQLEGSLASLFTGDPQAASKARAAATVIKAHAGNAVQAMEMLTAAQKNQATQTLGDVSQLGSPAQTAAQQAIKGAVAEPIAVHPEFATLPGAYQPNVQQTPLGQAQTKAAGALANLHDTQADAGGFNPNTGKGGLAGLNLDDGALLQQAVHDGRIDYTRVNSRTAPILVQMLKNEDPNNPTNFNRLHADAALQSNATFQQKAQSVDMLPGLISHVTTLGKKLNGGSGYNDIRAVGQMQKFMNGELNDPDYTEYMTARNDTLLRLAGVMRGVGMSDQAHTAEIEAMHPTLAPYALDAWAKGQMSVVNPLLERQNRITHLGEKGQGTAVLGAPKPEDAGTPATTAPAAVKPISLDDYLKSRGH